MALFWMKPQNYEIVQCSKVTLWSETFNIICYLFFLLRSVLTVEGLLGLR